MKLSLVDPGSAVFICSLRSPRTQVLLSVCVDFSVIISLSTNSKHTAGPTKAAHSLNHNTIVMDRDSVQVQAVCAQK